METNNKLREALVNISKYADCAAMRQHDAHTQHYIEQIRKWAEAALAEPQRNCEKYATVDEARKAWDDYLEKHPELPPSCKTSGAILQWLLAPATEQEGGAK